MHGHSFRPSDVTSRLDLDADTWRCEHLCLDLVAADSQTPPLRPEAERALAAALRLPRLRDLDVRLDDHALGNADGVVDWSLARGLRMCRLSLRRTGITTAGFVRWWGALLALPCLAVLEIDASDNRETLRFSTFLFGMMCATVARPALRRIRVDLRHNDPPHGGCMDPWVAKLRAQGLDVDIRW